jgi:hypothetical protein
MRIHATVTSPFVRKVLVTAHELGLQSQLDWTATNPHVDEYLRGDNPLCKIPTLLALLLIADFRAKDAGHWLQQERRERIGQSDRRSDGGIIIDLSEQLTSFRNFLESMMTAY